ncbi:FtsB/FtsL family cell division protein [Terriglobus tenax]|uniref:cell division protein FtsL n=1 Tax=Terriglobus tenax TaxID=1111115 RepID=UPI0021E0EAE6|nr:cell division protein FtsL [Terriglobus tenax]
MAAMAQTIEAVGRRKCRTESPAERNRRVYEAQRASRRGPTPEVLFHKYLDNSRIVKADDPVRKREMRTFGAACAVLFALMMVYVWQHFGAIETGYKLEATKQQVEQLREQNRQLRLQEAQLTDPERIHTMAAQLGLSAPLPGQVVRPDGLTDTNAPVVAQVTAH